MSINHCSSTQTGLIDYDKLEEKALEYRPKMIICGGSAYAREWNYARFREIADKVSFTASVTLSSSNLLPSLVQLLPVSAVLSLCSGSQKLWQTGM